MRSQKKSGSGSEHRGISRRDFLSTTGLGIVGLATGGTAGPKQEDTAVEAGERIPVVLQINGREHRILAEPRWSLGYVLHEELGLTGTKLSCERGECGSCTVLIDDVPRYACMVLVPEAVGTEITTIEGLLKGEDLGDVQRAFAENDALQCGYCTSGQIMAVEGLLRSNPGPPLAQIQKAVSGNLCRCGAYVNIFKAARQASEERLRSGGGS
jgi:xanthine dehydrogenase YagT iron-sulfur-binding subunit